MIRCIIIEDEPLAAEILQDYIAQVPFLELAGTYTNALAALEVIQSGKIDLLFLDIHLPGLKGLDFLKIMKDPPAVILTTAYHQYAVQSYELNVVDYLLKPYEFVRFLEAVNKVRAKFSAATGVANLIIQRDKKTIIIPTADILYLESQKEYVKVQCKQTAFTVKSALVALESQLSKDMFLRIHRSFIIAIRQVTAYSATEVELNTIRLPIGGNYRNDAMEQLRSLLQI
jgi:DNA-binding LytR/AlgR family response regulator